MSSDRTMQMMSVAMTAAVAAAYEWHRFPVIADIGGGTGAQLVALLAAAPRSRGILFDLPDVVETVDEYERVIAVGGDFFESVPAGADAYVLRWVLHEWGDAEAATILDVVRETIEPTARLILVEHVVPDGPAFEVERWRTESEYHALLADAGFRLNAVVKTASPLSLLVASPSAIGA